MRGQKWHFGRGFPQIFLALQKRNYSGTEYIIRRNISAEDLSETCHGLLSIWSSSFHLIGIGYFAAENQCCNGCGDQTCDCCPNHTLHDVILKTKVQLRLFPVHFACFYGIFGDIPEVFGGNDLAYEKLYKRGEDDYSGCEDSSRL